MSIFLSTAEFLKKLFPFLKVSLLYAGIEKDERNYVADALKKTFLFFLFLFVLLAATCIFFGIKKYFFAFLLSIVFSIFVFLQQMFLPSVKAARRIKGVERNLLPALQSIFVQINSGVPLFEILVNVSESNHGEVSEEFKKTIKEINAGKSQTEAMEEMAARNPSLFFRRAIWQITNGMKSGADISAVIGQTISTLSEEQLIQIQSYGSRLSPLAMFYMLIGVILPALSIVFIILFLSFVNVSEQTAKIVFYCFYAVILFFQIMFVGMIGSRRPSLL